MLVPNSRRLTLRALRQGHSALQGLNSNVMNSQGLRACRRNASYYVHYGAQDAWHSQDFVDCELTGGNFQGFCPRYAWISELKMREIPGILCTMELKMLKIPRGLQITKLKVLDTPKMLCWDVVLLTCASWSSTCWKSPGLRADSGFRSSTEAPPCNLRFVSMVVDSDETKEPRLAPEISIALEMNRTERRTIRNVALP